MGLSMTKVRRYGEAFIAPLLAHLATSCGVAPTESEPVGKSRSPSIYGDDNRVEERAYADPTLRELAETRVGALIPAEYVSAQADGNYLLQGPTLGEHLPLCPTEPWLDQPALAYCSGLLARENTLITAGHCVPKEHWHDLYFVQGYALGDAYPVVPRSRVHALRRILAFENGDITSQSGDDWAIVQLASEGALPHINFEVPPVSVSEGDPVVVIGTSEGLPIKIEDGGVVFDDRASEYFETTSDTFAGGSGSPVFTPQGAYLGMVVGGGTDYAWDDSQQCLTRVRLAAPTSRGELVVRAAVLEAALTEALQFRPAAGTSGCALAPRAEFGFSSWGGQAAIGGLLVAATRRNRARRRARAARTPRA